MEKNILIVDDEPSMLELLTEFFTNSGLTVFSAASGQEALELLGHAQISVVVTDIAMPGMDGLELCRLVKKKNPIVIMIALTGNWRFFEITECRSVGFDDYFRKPVDLSQLLECVNGCFSRMDRWFNVA